jgi:acetyltransferase-like isoleucine patch superfamily enzyme
MRLLLRALLVLVPWRLRRSLLARWFGYQLDPTSHIGLSWVYPRHLVLAAHSSIGHLTVCVHLDKVELKEHATIGRGNWITGFPTTDRSHFAHDAGRRAELIVGEHAAITNRHLIDCTSAVEIGAFSTVAGFASQILTHSIDLERNRQESRPVTVGSYCFIGTNCVLLGGAVLPEKSVLGAKSLLNRAFDEPQSLYAGSPARLLKSLPPDYAYFHRQVGSVD